MNDKLQAFFWVHNSLRRSDFKNCLCLTSGRWTWPGSFREPPFWPLPLPLPLVLHWHWHWQCGVRVIKIPWLICKFNEITNSANKIRNAWVSLLRLGLSLSRYFLSLSKRAGLQTFPLAHSPASALFPTCTASSVIFTILTLQGRLAFRAMHF